MSEQIQQQAKQLGVGEDIAQQLGQTDFTIWNRHQYQYRTTN